MTGKGRRQMPHSVRNKRKTEWILAGLGFALFLPYFLAFWPGVSTPDSIWQLRQAMHLTNYQSQHPFLHTLMIEMCYRIGSSAAGALHDFTGGRLFTHLSDQTALYEAASASQTGIAADRIAGNPAFVNYGVALYSLVSMALLTAADMAVLRLLRRNGAPRWALGMLWLFFFAFPFNAVLSITMWKDVPFSAVVMLTMVTLWDHERNHRVWRRRGHAGFVLLGFLFCTLRSNGIAAWLFFTVVYLLVHRHALRRGRETGRILADLGLSLLCAALFLGPVQRAAHVEKADPTEMLSIPLQQVAYTIVRNGVGRSWMWSRFLPIMTAGCRTPSRRLSGSARAERRSCKIRADGPRFICGSGCAIRTAMQRRITGRRMATMSRQQAPRPGMRRKSRIIRWAFTGSIFCHTAPSSASITC